MTRLRNLLNRVIETPWAVLFLLAPLVGELLSSSSPLPGFLVAWLPLAALYGCGALLIREARVRWSLGWPAVFLMGAAYGIVEEGIVVRSFFDPGWKDLGLLAEYGRAAGVNWTWSHLLTLFHAAISIALPILVVELAFPSRRDRSWIGRRGMLWCVLGIGAWAIIGATGFMDASGEQLAAAAGVVALLVLAARAFRSHSREPVIVPPRTKRYFWLALLTGLITFLFPHAAAEGGELPAYWASVAMTVLPGVALLLWDRWSHRGTAWTDADRSALAGGGIGWLAVLLLLTGNPIVIATSAASMLAWWRWHRRMVARTVSVGAAT